MLRLDPSIRNRLLAMIVVTATLCLVVADLRMGWLTTNRIQEIEIDPLGQSLVPPPSEVYSNASTTSHDANSATLDPVIESVTPPSPSTLPLTSHRNSPQPLPGSGSTTMGQSHTPVAPVGTIEMSTTSTASLPPQLLTPHRVPTIDWQISEPIASHRPLSPSDSFDLSHTATNATPTFDTQVQLASTSWRDSDTDSVAPSRLPPQPASGNRIDLQRDPGAVDVGARTSTRTPNAAAPQDAEKTEEEQRPRRARSQNDSPASAPDTPERLGVPPPKEQPQFLRDSTVLLSPGEYQFEWGMTYTTNVSQTVVSRTLENQTLVANLTSTSRNLQIPLEFRVGIRPDVQGFISLPIGYAIQDVSLANTKDSESVFGLGDLGMGLTRVLRQGEQGKANILGTLACSAPTGATVIPAAQQLPGASLGNGFWTFTGGVTAVKSIDPVAVFFGINYTLTLDTALNEEVTINPGDILSYRLGTGFAINSRISLSTVFEGNYIGELQYNDRFLPGTAREPFTVRIASTIQTDPNRPGRIAKARRAKTTEPFVRFGLSDASPDVNLGIRWTY